jgi:cysteine-rich repeat protein
MRAACFAPLAFCIAAAACTNDYDGLSPATGGAPAAAPGGSGGVAPTTDAASSAGASGGAGNGAGGASSGGGGLGGGSAASSGGNGGAPPCGNGMLDPEEECDDAGTAAADGCSPDCLVECEGDKTVKHPDTAHCYRYIDDMLVAWQPGRDLCQALGPGWDLATITSEEERDFVDEELELPESGSFQNDDPFQYWLGARDPGTQDQYEWLNGEAWSYAPWDDDDPTGGAQDCIRLRALPGPTNDAFRDAVCELGSSALCEMQPAGTMP